MITPVSAPLSSKPVNKRYVYPMLKTVYPPFLPFEYVLQMSLHGDH